MIVPGSANPLLMAAAAQGTTYTVSRSLRFNSSDSAFCVRTPSSASNRKTWTFSCWVKRTSFNSELPVFNAYTSLSDRLFCGFIGGDVFQIYSPNGAGIALSTTAVYRDPSAWYHLVIRFDTTQATAANRVRIYINGTEQVISGTYPGQNTDWPVNNTVAHHLGWMGATYYFNGYLAECLFVDGTSLDPSSFAETNATTGQWVPKAYTGSYGTNGFKLDFADNSAATAAALGKDTSGNGNNWTPTNLSVTAGSGNDSLVDTPVSSGTDAGNGGEVRGNYCTWNPLVRSAQLTFSNGNLDLVINRTGSFVWSTVPGSVAVNSGKWYCEITCVNSSGSQNVAVGIVRSDQNLSGYFLPGDVSQFAYAYFGDGRTRYSTINSGQPVNYGASYTNGDIIGIAYDADAGTLVFYKNGVSQGTAFSSVSASIPWSPFAAGGNADNNSWALNAGQRPFAYPVSGFKALCDTNLPTPVVAKPSTVFDTTLWTGTNGANARTISGLSLSPDLVWIKVRNQAYSHQLFDAVRGTTKTLLSNSTSAEITNDASGTLSAFNSDGFTLSPVTNNNSFNTLNDTYVAWCWDAGSSNATNTQGSITSTVRANASAGFSIVTYTGTGSNATVGHGLNAAPELIFYKVRNAAYGWTVYAKAIGATKYLALDQTAAAGTYNHFQDTNPTSSIFYLAGGGANSVNENAKTYVAYCFAPVSGYSAMGSYTGNGSTDGPFCFTGMRPRWLVVKRSDSSDGGFAYWTVFDSARNTYNLTNLLLHPNLSNAEYSDSNYAVDFLANGFKVREDGGGFNANNGTYVWVAFAESPFQYARAR